MGLGARAARDGRARRHERCARATAGRSSASPRRSSRCCSSSAEFLDALVARTLAVLEDGSPPHVDIVRRVEIPPHDAPWLQPLYDEAEFIIRNVIRYYGGWWTGGRAS